MELAFKNKESDLVRVRDEASESYRFVRRDKGYNTQLFKIEEVLSRFGLLKNEIHVYLFLARVGKKKAGEIAEAISLHRTETYRILRDLEKKGIVFSVFEKPLKFTAVPLDNAIDLLIDAQKMKIQLLEKEKTGLVNIWQSMPQPKVEKVKKEIFQILEGGQQMVLKANELLERSKTEFQILAPSEYLAQLYHSDFTDKLGKRLGKLKITLLTDNSPKSRYFLEQMKWPLQNYRVVDAGNLPCFMISDGKELLMAVEESEMTEEGSGNKKSKTVALWTNYTAFVLTLQTLLSKLLESKKSTQHIYIKQSN
jgi:sugar-specific transcriptional regulator TrmB